MKCKSLDAMTEQTLVEYREQRVTFNELSELTGIKIATLRYRWSNGHRGEKLWQPLERVGVSRPAGGDQNTDLKRMQDEIGDKRERQACEDAERMEHQRKRQAIIDAVKAAHADLFAQPLIDSRLLTDAEHKQIRDRVSFSAQRFWSVKGASR